MENNVLWDTIRNMLIAIGMIMSLCGWVESTNIAPFVDNLMTIVGAIFVIGTFIWTIKVKLGTKAVPTVVADLPQIPTVSPITGKVMNGVGH